MVWIVRVNPDGSQTYYTKKGKMTERRALGFCSSYQSWYNNQYPDMNYRFITKEDSPKPFIEEQPMLYWVYTSIGLPTNDGPVRFDLARKIVDEHEDYTMSEAC